MKRQCSESRGFEEDDRRVIECGAQAEMIVIHYGDSTIGSSDRVVTVESIFDAHGNLFMEGFCHTKGETRTFRFDRIHTVSELPQGGYYTSVSDWMRSFGVEIEIYQRGRTYRYRLSDPRVRRQLWADN